MVNFPLLPGAEVTPTGLRKQLLSRSLSLPQSERNQPNG